MGRREKWVAGEFDGMPAVVRINPESGNEELVARFEVQSEAEYVANTFDPDMPTAAELIRDLHGMGYHAASDTASSVLYKIYGVWVAPTGDAPGGET